MVPVVYHTVFDGLIQIVCSGVSEVPGDISATRKENGGASCDEIVNSSRSQSISGRQRSRKMAELCQPPGSRLLAILQTKLHHLRPHGTAWPLSSHDSGAAGLQTHFEFATASSPIKKSRSSIPRRLARCPGRLGTGGADRPLEFAGDEDDVPEPVEPALVAITVGKTKDGSEFPANLRSAGDADRRRPK